MKSFHYAVLLNIVQLIISFVSIFLIRNHVTEEIGLKHSFEIIVVWLIVNVITINIFFLLFKMFDKEEREMLESNPHSIP